MALAQNPQPMTEEEYLVFERNHDLKHEFYNGDVYAMAGASRYHTLIIGRLVTALNNQLIGKGCETYPTEMKVHVPNTRTYVYPDVTVICEEPQFLDEQADVLMNPLAIIEVLSPSTERRDRGLKFRNYRELASLQDYVLVAQNRPHMERFSRQQGKIWQFTEAIGLSAELDLPSLSCRFILADIYSGIPFEEDHSAES